MTQSNDQTQRLLSQPPPHQQQERPIVPQTTSMTAVQRRIHHSQARIPDTV